MKKYWLLLLLATPLLSIAQSNFKKGYVVTLKDDTLQGYIDHKEWIHNPKIIRFKTRLDAKIQDLTVNDIRYLEIDKLVSYVRYVVNVSTDIVDPTHASIGIDTSTRLDTIFLKVLQRGKNLILYAYSDQLKNRFYIKDKAMETPKELTYRVYIVQDDPQDKTPSNTRYINKNNYYDQLTILASKYVQDLDKINTKIHQLSYNESEIMNIVSLINGYSKEDIASVSNKGSNLKLSVGIGYTLNSMKYEGLTNYSNPNGTTSNSPQITIGLSSYLNPDVGRIIFRMELSLVKNKYKFTPIYYDPAQEHELEINTIALTPQVIYNLYNTANFKGFIDIGISLNALSYSKNVFPVEFASFASSIPIKAGAVLFKKIELFSSFTPAYSILGKPNFLGHIITYQFGVNYLFGKK